MRGPCTINMQKQNRCLTQSLVSSLREQLSPLHLAHKKGILNTPTLSFSTRNAGKMAAFSCSVLETHEKCPGFRGRLRLSVVYLCIRPLAASCLSALVITQDRGDFTPQRLLLSCVIFFLFSCRGTTVSFQLFGVYKDPLQEYLARNVRGC